MRLRRIKGVGALEQLDGLRTESTLNRDLALDAEQHSVQLRMLLELRQIQLIEQLFGFACQARPEKLGGLAELAAEFDRLGLPPSCIDADDLRWRLAVHACELLQRVGCAGR